MRRGRHIAYSGLAGLIAVIGSPSNAQRTPDPTTQVEPAQPSSKDETTPLQPSDRPTSAHPADTVTPSASSGTGVAGIPPTTAETSLTSRFDHFDSFLEPGQTTNYPGSADTLLRDTGGFRTWLSDHDIGLRALQTFTVADDLSATGQPRNPQRFNGQRATIQATARNFNLAWGLNSLGLPNTKILFGVNNFVSTYATANGKNTTYIRTLALYQSFLNGKLTIKAGLDTNNYDYVGFFVGGSPVLAAGVTGLLPIQAGLGADPANLPLVNVTAYGSKGKYIRVGVQRSFSPQGLNYEIDKRHGIGINVTLPGARPLYIGEVGIRRPATADGKQIWLRVGGFYNSTNYQRVDGKGTGKNSSFYALADLQITQPNKHQPARGLYVGASAFWIPQSVNTSNQSYEIRAFDIGLLPQRPQDTVALRVTWTKYSDDARLANLATGTFANREQTNVTASYSAPLYHGLYVVPSISYIDHPSFIGDYKPAALGTFSILMLL